MLLKHCFVSFRFSSFSFSNPSLLPDSRLHRYKYHYPGFVWMVSVRLLSYTFLPVTPPDQQAYVFDIATPYRTISKKKKPATNQLRQNRSHIYIARTTRKAAFYAKIGRRVSRTRKRPTPVRAATLLAVAGDPQTERGIRASWHAKSTVRVSCTTRARVEVGLCGFRFRLIDKDSIPRA